MGTAAGHKVTLVVNNPFERWDEWARGSGVQTIRESALPPDT